MSKKKLVIFLVVFFPSLLWAVNGREVGNFSGIQAVEVWGSNWEMGEALAHFQADGIAEIASVMRALPLWPELVKLAGSYAWDADQIEIMQAIADNVPGVELEDLQVISSYGDWSYNHCRGFALWGALAGNGGSVTGRKLIKDDIPASLAGNHAIIFFQPDDRPAWANFTAPGAVVSATGINEFGYLFAIHDHCSRNADSIQGLMTRTGACGMLSRASDPGEAQSILLENPGSTGSYIYFWGGAGNNTGGAVFSYGKAGRLYGGERGLFRRDPCPEKIPAQALTCANDIYLETYGDCSPGVDADSLLGAITLSAYTLEEAEQVVSHGSHHSVYAEARRRREIDFYMWARVSGEQVRTPVLKWENCFTHSLPVPPLPKIEGEAGGESLSLSVKGRITHPGKRISFSLPNTGYVNLGIYRLDGSLVCTLVNRRLYAGKYRVPWNGADNSGKQRKAGEYLVKLRTPRDVLIEKFIFD